MRYEFNVDLRKARKLRSRDNKRLYRELAVRKFLILAHQIRNIVENNPKITHKEIAGWIGYAPPRISQITNLLFLSPFIQEEIIIPGKHDLYKININMLHRISQELLWNKQKEMWLEITNDLKRDTPKPHSK